MNEYTILFVPETNPRHGTGHISRVIYYSTHLFTQADIMVHSDADKRRIKSRYPDFPEARLVIAPTIRTKYHVIVIDTRVIPQKIRWYRSIGEHIVGFDTIGRKSLYFDYIIDLLPRLSGSSNITQYSLLPLPPKRPLHTVNASPNILVRFGGTKGDVLAIRIAKKLLHHCKLAPFSLHVVLSDSSRQDTNLSVHWIAEQSNFRTRLANYDILITSFGIMAIEAIASGCYLLLINYTRYHSLLAGKLHLSSMHRNAVSTGTLCNLVHNIGLKKSEMMHARSALYEHTTKTLPTLIFNVAQSPRLQCPLCNHPNSYVLARFPTRTYRKCISCKFVFMHSHNIPAKDYNSDYFNIEYKKQYGKSYLEDHDAIYAMGMQRMQIINSLLSPVASKSLLDVGCAYGHFLKAALKHNFRSVGLDVSEDATKYIDANLKIPAINSHFLEFNPLTPAQTTFSVITMWYVIEHFWSIQKVLQKVATLLEPQGIFAFSTPNIRSFVARKSLYQVLHQSPADHYLLFDPHRIRRHLKRHGFRVRKIVIHGHHPENYPHYIRPLSPWVSSLFKLGTTFSVYAQYGA